MQRLLTSPTLRLALALALLVAGTLTAALAGGPSPSDVRAWVASGGVAGPLLFVLLYVALTVLLFPGALLTGAGGALFGVVLGTGLSVVGATAGATAAFLIGRRLGRRTLERAAGQRVRAVDAWLGRRGFTAVLYLRLVPIVPFNALNYAAGVSAVSTRDYVLGTALGIVPGAFAYAALGGSIDDPLSPEFLGAVALALALAVVGGVAARRRRRPAPDAQAP
jgi:MYXO-CTERM domain-containing protein